MAAVKYDWAAIEEQYRAGQMSLRAIGEQHGCTEGAIRKRAKAHGWERDLSDKVRREVRTQLVRSQVRTNATEEEIIEAAASTGAQVIQKHRGIIARTAALAESMLIELENPIEDMELSKRAVTLRTLGDTVQRVVTMERQAYNLDEEHTEDSLEDRLMRLAAQNTET